MQAMVDVYRRWQEHESVRSIAQRLGMHRRTIRQLLRRAEARGWTRDTTRSAEEWGAFVREEFGGRSDPAVRAQRWSELEPYREEIKARLGKNRTATVYERLRAEGKVSVSLATFRRYVRSTLPAEVTAREVVVHGPEPQAGEAAEVDFGRLGWWADPASERRRTLWAFIMVLAYSRHVFVAPLLKLDQRAWLDCHLRAFRFFNGVTRRIVLDNLKDGVVRADLYDPSLNRAYAEMAMHYGVFLDPARPGHPKDKPRVERLVPFVREHLYKGREQHFANLAAGRLFAERWCRDEAGMRMHRTTRQRPLERFEAEEAATLRPLPRRPWEPCNWEKAKVAPDAHCLAAGGGLYSVPYRLIGHELDVRVTDSMVELYAGSELIRTHVRVGRGKRSTNPDDLPEDRIAFYQRTPQWCLREVAKIGASASRVAEELLRENTLTHLRQVQGVLRLSDRYGRERLEAACARALACGDASYRTVRNILAAGLDRANAPTPQSLFVCTPPSAGAFLRGPGAYATGASVEDAE